MKIAAYVRPWSKCYYEYFLAAAFPGQQHCLLSDWKGLGEFDWSSSFYRLFKLPANQLHSPYWLSTSDILEIIVRSFLLRSMSIVEAMHLVRCMSSAISEMLDYVQPDLLFSPAIDSYVMDLLMRHCVHRRIPYCGMLPSPITGYTRITAVGEQLSFRDPSDLEIQDAIRLVSNPSFSPVDLREWMKMYGNRNVSLKRALRELPKPYYFPLVGFLRGDPRNYHYKASAETAVSSISQSLFVDRFFDNNWLDRVRSWSGTKIYIPLQAFPECTTDYHVDQLDLIDFHNVLPRLVDSLCADENNLVCIKEHPGMQGARPAGFYDLFRHRHNVVLVSSGIPASVLIAETDVVVTWTGTGGLEAAIRGKPVVTIGKPYYSVGMSFLNLTNIQEVDNASELIRDIFCETPSAGNKYEIIKHVLSGTFAGEYRFIRFDKTDADLIYDIEQLVVSTTKYWKSWSQAFAKHYGFNSAKECLVNSDVLD